MMRHLASDNLGDLAAIYDEDVELVSIARPAVDAFSSLRRQLAESRQTLELRWAQAANDPEATGSALPESIDPQARQVLATEISQAGDLLGELLGCMQVGIRLVSLRAPMCPRFHVDQVPCRMLITLGGPGTEWIAGADVDRAVFADRGNKQAPVRAGGHIQQLEVGSWSLLKGGAWDEHYGGVVHRSPQQDAERLLLTIDPIFDSRDAA